MFLALVDTLPVAMAVLMAWVLFHHHEKYDRLKVRVLTAALAVVGILTILAFGRYWNAP